MKKVSVFMPCYNGERFIGKAIESILQQTYGDFELIIIDDGSKDNSFQIMKEFAENDKRIKIYSNGCNKGVAYTRNRGLELCEGEYIALLDADDIAIYNRLEIEVAFLDNNEEIAGVFGNYQIISETGEKREIVSVGEKKHEEIETALFWWNILPNGSAMFRKEIVEKYQLGYFNEMQCGIEDFRFWQDCIKAGLKFAIIPQILYFYRVVKTGVTCSNRVNQRKKRYFYHKQIHEEFLRMHNIDLPFLYKKIYLYSVCTPKVNYFFKIFRQLFLSHFIQEIKKQAVKFSNPASFIEECDSFYERSRIHFELIFEVFQSSSKL